MNYFLDQEFNEGFRKPLRWLPTIGRFNKPYHFIDLISIGLVCEDGREYYAVCKEFDVRAAYNKYQVEKIRNHGDSRNISEYRYERTYWLRENVLKPIFANFYNSGLVNLHGVTSMSLHNMKQAIKYGGKSKKQIAQEIKDFVYPIKQIANYYYVSTGDHPDIVGTDKLTISDKKGRLTFSIWDKELEPELNAFKPIFYGYYSDYDWVLFCSLFGDMMDLPKGFPMYCRDLQQQADHYKVLHPITKELVHPSKHPNYPQQSDEHHALYDAKWNKRLFAFLKTI